jgi:hypothetical protein
MAYIGKSPVIGNFVKLDAISVVNGQAAYTMQNGGSNFTDYESVNQFLVSLNGTIQAPTDSFTVSGSTLTFASNLSTGDVIDFIMVFGNSLSAGTPTDATVTAAKLNSTAITGQTAEATVANDDTVLIHDTSASALRKMTVSNLTANAGVAGISSSADATAITIDSSERVGIGTTSPAHKLDVDGNIQISGNFSSGSPSPRLEIGTYSSSGADAGMEFSTFTSSGDSIIQYCSTERTAGTNIIEFHNPNGEVGGIRTDGSATSYNTSSDYRLKENVSYDFNATTRLKQLKPARFNFITDPNKTVDGFLAHEVSSIVPEAVSKEKDAVKEDGTPDYQGIDQSKLVPLLVKTIQELEARITQLENA